MFLKLRCDCKWPWVAETSLKKKTTQNWSTHTSWFQNLLQKHDNHAPGTITGIIPKKQNWESRNKCVHLRPTDIWQGWQDISVGKEWSLLINDAETTRYSLAKVGPYFLVYTNIILKLIGGLNIRV